VHAEAFGRERLGHPGDGGVEFHRDGLSENMVVPSLCTAIVVDATEFAVALHQVEGRPRPLR
jgi:hypothetical protein